MRESVYFPFLAPEQELRADLELSFPARGRYSEKNFGLATRFPFSFLMKTRRINLAREMIVYPVVETTEQFLEVLPMVTGEFETFVQRTRKRSLSAFANTCPTILPAMWTGKRRPAPAR